MAVQPLDVTVEAFAEVLLSKLAALYYLYRHTKEYEVADYIRETSLASFGLTPGVLQEAREYRKLTRGLDAGSA